MRFQHWRETLGIASDMTARRLTTLVDSALLERRLYRHHPPRYDYLGTERGRDSRAVLWTLLAWGNKYFAPEVKSVVLVNSHTGAEAELLLVDAVSGRPMVPRTFSVVPGAGANLRTRQRHRAMSPESERVILDTAKRTRSKRRAGERP